ncbi:hypothetical protein R3P38DRAFT_2891180 [Favolaschia claudopus]|uniref:Uncharacterized protein n=1 Tax=Favolaschia claudopus TaxID=2862362 RepID=A0AAW0CRG1_9AGAR
MACPGQQRSAATPAGFLPAAGAPKKRKRDGDTEGSDSGRRLQEWQLPSSMSEIVTSQNGMAEAFSQMAQLASYFAKRAGATASSTQTCISRDNQDFKNALDETVELRAKVAELTAHLASNARTINMWKDHHAAITNSVRTLEQNLQVKEQQCKAAMDRMDKVNHELKEKNATIETLRAQLAEEIVNAEASKAAALSNEQKLFEQLQEVSGHCAQLQSGVTALLSRRIVS